MKSVAARISACLAVIFLLTGCGIFSSSSNNSSPQGDTKNQQVPSVNADPKQQSNNQANLTANQQGQVNVTVANVRTGPSVDTAQLRQLSKGQKVTVVRSLENDKKETWYEIKTADGAGGFIRNDLVDLLQESTNQPVNQAVNQTASQSALQSSPQTAQSPQHPETSASSAVLDKSSFEKSIAGKWRTMKFVLAGPGGMTVAEGKKWMGQQGNITPNSIAFGNNIYPAVTFKGTVVKTEAYFKNLGNVKEHFNIMGEHVWVVEADKDGPYTKLIVVDDSNLLTFWNGAYFLLQRES